MHERLLIDPISGHVFWRPGRPYKQRNPQGYVQVCLAGRYYGVVHRIIWESVHGPIPDGLQINHKNGIKFDNRIANLELVTPSENTKHAYRIGLIRADGDNNGRRKYRLKALAARANLDAAPVAQRVAA